MLDSIETIQRENLESIIDASFQGSRSAFVDFIGVHKGVVDKMFADPKKTGYKPMGYQNLRRIEIAMGLPEGWLDTPESLQDGRLGILPVRDRRRVNVQGLIDLHFEGQATRLARAIGETDINICRPLKTDSKWVKHFGSQLIRRIEGSLMLKEHFLDHPQTTSDLKRVTAIESA